PLGLFRRMYVRGPSRGRTRLPSTLIESRSGSAFAPSETTRPLISTRPSRIHSSASRRAASPASAISFWTRTPPVDEAAASGLVRLVVVIAVVLVVLVVFVVLVARSKGHGRRGQPRRRRRVRVADGRGQVLRELLGLGQLLELVQAEAHEEFG